MFPSCRIQVRHRCTKVTLYSSACPCFHNIIKHFHFRKWSFNDHLIEGPREGGSSCFSHVELLCPRRLGNSRVTPKAPPVMWTPVCSWQGKGHPFFTVTNKALVLSPRGLAAEGSLLSHLNLMLPLVGWEPLGKRAPGLLALPRTSKDRLALSSSQSLKVQGDASGRLQDEVPCHCVRFSSKTENS